MSQPDTAPGPSAYRYSADNKPRKTSPLSAEDVDTVYEHLLAAVRNGRNYPNSRDLADELEIRASLVGEAVGELIDAEGCPLEIERWSGEQTSPARWHVQLPMSDGGVLDRVAAALPGGSGGTIAADAGTLLYCLANQRRRDVIRILAGDPGAPIVIEALSRQIAAIEEGIAPENIGQAAYKRVYVSLYQTHLGVLDDAGLCDYDDEANIVSATPATDVAAELISEIEARCAGDEGNVERELVTDGGETIGDIEREAIPADDYGYLVACPNCGVMIRLKGTECNTCGVEFSVSVEFDTEPAEDDEVRTDGGETIDADELERRKHQRSSTSPDEMERVTIRMPAAMLDAIDGTVQTGLFPSRSEAIRTAVRERFLATDGGHNPGPDASPERDLMTGRPIDVDREHPTSTRNRLRQVRKQARLAREDLPTGTLAAAYARLAYEYADRALDALADDDGGDE